MPNSLICLTFFALLLTFHLSLTIGKRSCGKRGRMIGIDLFAGAGGMSVGAAVAGVRIALAVEADAHAALTYQFNHPSTNLFKKDIRRLTKRRLASITRKGKPTIVFGGPPCQGFSYSNQRTRSSDNPENWLFLEFLRVVRIWEPDWVVFENVKGITNTEGGTFLTRVIEDLDRQRYSLKVGLLNAVDFGVPQSRERLFVVASRSGLTPELPMPIKGDHITVSDAISDLPELCNGATESWKGYEGEPTRYARVLRRRLRRSPNHLTTHNAPYVLERYSHIPQGGNWMDIPRRLMRNYADRSRCHTGIYHRLDENKPSIVIGNFRKNMLIHPTQNRGLSVREAARIQSFPDGYEFQGSIGFQQQQVGNAVPPMLAEAVFRQILGQGRP